MTPLKAQNIYLQYNDGSSDIYALVKKNFSEFTSVDFCVYHCYSEMQTLYYPNKKHCNLVILNISENSYQCGLSTQG
jgi:hypothetical protein